MGFNFRKSLKIAPGIRLNLTKKGVSSVSFGGRGVKVNVGKKGTRTTVSAPGTGLSYKHFSPKKEEITSQQKMTRDTRSDMDMSVISNIQPLTSTSHHSRQISVLLVVGIFIMPYIFAWFTLREGYSKTVRYVSFGWLLFLVLLSMQN